ncbi:MAG: hypothetical protein HY296_01645 [Thaumarchaeota archaeon]|nr:hypothetical protein [Nitrososphaerota archaeon]
MAFLVLEGFSGSGKTTLAKRLQKRGWMRLQESAHILPQDVPVADRGDTYSDFSLLGATLAYSSTISRSRGRRNLVSEGYLPSDLAYAKIRYELKKSLAYPAMMTICKSVLADPTMRPDLYVLLTAGHGTLSGRQAEKENRDRNPSMFFRERYYTALREIHQELGETEQEEVRTDSDPDIATESILEKLSHRKMGA